MPRRLWSGALGWRVSLESRLAQYTAQQIDEETEDNTAGASDAILIAESAFERRLSADAPLTVETARLLRTLQDERLRISRQTGRPPRAVASDAALRALAVNRPQRLDHPLLAEVTEARAFLERLKDLR